MVEAITIKNLVKEYPKVTAVNNLSLSIKEGDFFGLLGRNGAGKTTTIHIITGLANKTSGEVKLFGKDVVKEYKEARALIGLVPQEFNFDQFETVYNILYFNAGYFGIPKKERLPIIEKILKELDLWEKRDSKAITLSGGMKRKLMIGRALIHSPKILILDEPTAGVDVETRKLMYNYFRDLNKKGITILLTTHYLEEAEELCNKIAIINKGEIIKVDEKKNLLKLMDKDKVRIILKEPIKKIPPSLSSFSAKLYDKTIVLNISTKDDLWNKLLKTIQELNLSIEKIETSEAKLEDIFLELTKK